MDEIQEQVTLTLNHSMIYPHIPGELKLKPEIGSLSKNEIGIFGLFSDSPSFNSYYPNIKMEDINPKDEEYIQPLFRLLSNTVVISNRGLIEFPEDVIKNSVSKLRGQSIYPNHDSQIGNELGVVLDTVWQESYKMGDITIPSGINGRLKIDAKSNPTIARGILMDPPSIHSVSCTVVYKFVKSHPDMSDNDFWDKMGIYDSKGNLVRKIATDILYYTELSLVPGGADPFAKKLDKNGKIVLPKFANDQSVKSNFSYSIDWSDSKSFINNEKGSFNGLFNIDSNNKKEKKMTPEELITLVSVSLGLSGLTVDNFKVEVEKFSANQKKLVDPISLEIGDIKGFDKIKESFNAMKTEVEELRPLKEKESFIKAGETHLENERTEAVKFYKLTLKEGQTEDSNIINLINSGSIDQVVSLKKQYGDLANEKVPLTCSKCGSHEVSRVSSIKDDGKGKTEDTAMTFDEMRRKAIEKTYYGIEDKK